MEIHERHLVADGGPYHGPGAFQGARLGREGIGGLEKRRMMGEEHVGPGLSGSGHSTRRGVQGHGHPGHGQRALPHQKPGAVPLLGILGRELLQQRLLQAADGHVERARREMGLAPLGKSLSAGLVGLVEQSHMISFFLGTESARLIADAPYSMVMLRRSPVAVGTVTLL